MSIILYGIPNCDTVKKSRAWLEDQGIAYTFHDYKKLGADAKRIEAWLDKAGMDRVLNKAGTTYRKLPDAVKATMTRETALKTMVEQPSTIKRPIVEYPNGLLVGFNPVDWQKALC